MTIIKSVKNSSLWNETETMLHFAPLDQDTEVDVCVVGGGIAGLTTAYLLTREGKRVCVLESAELCSGQTSRTTAHFSTALDDRYFNLEKYHGTDGAKLAFESHSEAIHKVKEIIKYEGIDCELEVLDGYLFSADDPRLDVLDLELNAAHRAGLIDVEHLNFSPLNSFDAGPCLHFSNQMKLHPLKYLNALSQIIIKAGGQIYTHTHVVGIEGGERAEVKTKIGHTVRCQAIVMATNSPINDRVVIHTKQAAYRSYVLGFKIPKESVKNALYWDTLESYHYIRVEPKSETHDVLIVGGADHKTGQDDNTETHFETLENWVRIRFPMAQDLTYKWSGQVMEPVDGLAYLGRNPMDKENVYVITGDSGNGMTHCTIGAMLVTDLILKRKNPWTDLYSPNRISLKSMPRYVKENANVMAQYTEWMAAKSTPDFDSLLSEEGVVFRDGLKMVAAYKNDLGEIKFVSAACPHLGGIVHWNKVEKSWDCPCHGSRFKATGEVIEGPAVSDLEIVDFKLIPLKAIPLKELENREKARVVEISI
jgi:glycine/D-amino acid oxidase-like deaminating enzyme/nitrite reductase/ring-hydroxylating ferredoxin subunit